MSQERSVRAGVYAESGAHVSVEQLVVVGGVGFGLRPPARPIDDTESVVEALRPGAAVVPVGDESAALLAALAAWRDAGHPLAVGVLRGPAGSGKTRVASEFAAGSAQAGWLAGFVDDSAGRGVIESPSPTLFVVDYAEAAPSTVIRALLALRQAQDMPRRLLLLVRAPKSTKAIIDELLVFADSTSDRDDVRRELRAATEFSFIDEFAPSVGALADLYQRALIAFARLPSLSRGRGPSMSVPVHIGRPPYTTPLMVSAAAALRVLEGKEGSLTADDVLDEVLAHERRYWARRVEEMRVAIEPRRRDLAGAVFTVAPGGDRADAQALLKALPGLADDALATERDKIAGWWLSTYPDGRDRVRPVEPDLIGERLIASLLGGEGDESAGVDVLLAVAGYASAAGRRALLRTLTRAAPESAVLAGRLHDLLAAQLPAFVGDVKAEARRVDQPEPVANTLAIAVSQLGTLVDADQVAAELTAQPRSADTPASLRPLITALARVGAASLGEGESVRRAAALSLEATMSGLIGRPQDALDAAVEAVRIRRALAARESELYQPSLAQSLSTLSNRLSDVGRRPEARAAAEEAVRLIDRLVADGRQSSRVDLGVSLNTLAAARAAAGDDPGALEAAERAVSVFKELSDEPGGEVYLGDYAMTLTTLGNRLNNDGEFERARDVAEQSLAIRRRLAEDDPDLQEPNIALCLNNLAMIYANLDRLDDAFEASSAAVEARRRLAARAPDVYSLGLARALSTHGNRAGALRRDDDAVEFTRQSVAVLDELAKRRRQAILPELAGALNNYSAALQRQKRYEEAIAPAERAAACYDELVEEGELAYADSRAAGLRTLAAAYGGAHRLDDAVATGERELAIRERLAELPAAAHRVQLARCLNSLAELVEGNGDPDRAARLRGRAGEIHNAAS